MGLSLLPVWLARIYVRSAALVDPGGSAELAWRVALGVVSVVVFGHVVAACAKGGRLRHFLWPVGSLLWWVRLPRRPGTYARIRDGFWEFLRGFRFPHYFRVGGVGFGGTLVWLAPPAFLISRSGPAPLLGVLGVLWLGIVVPFLPFLQVRYAVEGNWRALFQVRGVKDRFKRAPWAFAVALMALLLAAIPLYLLKIETIPREASWLPALVFVVFLMPARILTGWAYARAIRREKPRHWFFRVLGRVAIVPAAVLYVLIVFFAQYTSWGGSWSLYEQHAFLLPVPFLHQ
jgi:hypothetical protein